MRREEEEGKEKKRGRNDGMSMWKKSRGLYKLPV